ncbi:MAG: nicotinate-nucleotide--dimethylbenzimidazole phosphoribosyltransferase, partial [Ectothiorhodospiraceae bacterium]|nr:nicotinate-nucleotide--dimethylbenzimidazole phosphoribosyltransferase [Ectothiorhodospiraceae bacterium]
MRSPDPAPAIAAPDDHFRQQALARQNTLPKPPGSLGRLERLAADIAAQQGRAEPSVGRVHITVFAGDHGVCAEGVSAFPQAVTAQMVANFAAGGAAINVLARALGATLDVVNVGTVEPLPAMDGVREQRAGDGTANICREPAMDGPQLTLALAAGDQAAARAAAAACELFIGGEMGIGNTTAAAAVACALTGAAPADMVGRGTGVDDAGLARKR